jgi:hypothetical protein
VAPKRGTEDVHRRQEAPFGTSQSPARDASADCPGDLVVTAPPRQEPWAEGATGSLVIADGNEENRVRREIPAASVAPSMTYAQ